MNENTQNEITLNDSRLAITGEEFFALSIAEKSAMLQGIEKAIDTLTDVSRNWKAETILSKIGKDRKKVQEKLGSQVVNHMHKAMIGVDILPSAPLKSVDVSKKAPSGDSMPIKIMADATAIKSGYDLVKTEETELYKSTSQSNWNNAANRIAQEIMIQVWDGSPILHRRAWLAGNTPKQQEKIEADERKAQEAEELRLAELKVNASKGDEEAKAELESIQTIEAQADVIPPEPKGKTERNPKTSKPKGADTTKEAELLDGFKALIQDATDLNLAPPARPSRLAKALLESFASADMPKADKLAFTTALYQLMKESI